MTIRIGINGFGRIGRTIFRIVDDRNDMQVVAINDLFPPRSLAYLLKYDTVMGTFEKPIVWENEALIVAGRRIPLTSERDPARVPCGAIGLDVSVDAARVLREPGRLGTDLQAEADE